MNIPTPREMEFQQWANAVAEQYAKYGLSGPGDGDWMAWACSVLNAVPGVLPNPTDYINWVDWAEQFYGCVR